MAFCTNCGKSLQEGARFCTNCGTPAPVAVAAPVPPPNVRAVTAPAAALIPEPTAPASENRGAQPEVAAQPVSVSDMPSSVPYDDFTGASQPSTSPVFVIVCVLLLLLIAVGIAGTVYLQRQGKAKAAAASAGTNPASSTSPATSAPTPATSEPTASATTLEPARAAASTPAPVADSIRVMNLGDYPGATPVAIATLTGETVVAGFLTRDTPQQVIQFYKIRFPASTTIEGEGKAELSATLPGGERIRIQAQSQVTSTQVMVLQEN